MVSENHCERSSYDPNFPLHLDIHPSAIPAAHHTSFTDTNELEIIFGSVAQELAIKKYGIAGRVWEAAYAMLSYIQPPQGVEFDPPFVNIGSHTSDTSVRRSMVELGSGSGLVASMLIKILNPIRDHLIATDLPEVCPLLHSNLCPDARSNHSSKTCPVTVMPFSWGKYEDALRLASFLHDRPEELSKIGPLTHIICSDLIYFPELLAPLLRSLIHLTSPPFVKPTTPGADSIAEKQTPTVVISYKLRSLAKETRFWSAFGLWFDFTPVLVKDHEGEWKRFGSDMEDTTFLFIAHRRPESYGWGIALIDEHLLSGIGAHGTSTPKGDDIFEGLLLMSLDQS